MHCSSASLRQGFSLFFFLVVIRLYAQPVDVSSVVGKVICGYQGWFTCYGDGSPIASWRHWTSGVYQSDTPKPSPGNVTFDLYPDVSDYGPSQLFQTGLGPLADGRPAKLFSSYQTATINQHFAWMQQHGIDGVALQRFIAETYDGVFKAHRDSVTARLRRAAEQYQRGFYLMYDLSGFDMNQVDYLKNDWLTTMTGALNVTASPAYFRQDGKPVVALWGVGFGHISGDAAQHLALINWFKAQGCYVVGGLPTHWRNGVGDAKPGFDAVWQALDMISPWTVGRYNNLPDVDNYKVNFLQPDRDYCNNYGIDYQPVVFPGSATFNWNGGPVNETPRLAGAFFWRQAHNIRSLGIPSMYVAMFDEYDEATAIAPGADSYFMTPVDQYFLTYSADGKYVSPDFYLRLTGEATRLIKNQIPPSSTFATPLSAGPVFFRTSLEQLFDALPDWTNSIDPSTFVNNVSGTAPGGIPSCVTTSLNARIGGQSIRLHGNDNSASASFAYYRMFNVNIPVDSNLWLGFWTFPENELSRHVTVDLLMTDGSTLRDSGAEDENGQSMHPGDVRGTVGQWTETRCRIGKWLAGKTIDRVLVAYDYGPDTGPFSAYVDDIALFRQSGTSSAPDAPGAAGRLRLYPNPVAEGRLTVELPEGGAAAGAELRIFRVDGQMAAVHDWPGGARFDLPTGHLPAGVYGVTVRDRTRVYVGKFIKQ